MMETSPQSAAQREARLVQAPSVGRGGDHSGAAREFNETNRDGRARYSANE